MATTNLITNITKSGDYPISAVCSATNNCGLLSLMLPTQWTEQMLYELPTLNIKIFMSDGTQLVSFDVDMSTVNRDTLEQSEPYSIPIYNLPSDFTFSITPLFDKYALQSHNDQIDTGDFGSFTTSETGIVDTNIKDYSSLYWTTPTQTFNISIDFDDSNIVAGGGSGGGGGGGSITIDTQVNGTSTNAVQNKAIYNFVNSSVATNTANFIDTFNSVEELEAYTGTVTNNDYAFVIGTDSDGNTIYNRYKYNGSEWVFEYTLNNSSFTAAQWATIQSGLTASDKTKLDGIEAGANKTVVDANLSQTSTNPVQNKTVNAALSTKQDTIADLSEIRSGAAAGSTAVQQTTFETDQQRQETEIGVVANAGAKNLLKITATSQTIRGVTFTVNDDQTVTVNGTNDGTGASSFVIVPNAQAITIPDGNYILSGCPASGESISTVPYDLRWYRYSQGKSAYDIGSGASVTKDGDTTDSNIAIVVKTGQTANNLIFKPMIRPAEITDSTYVPYAPTNRELYETKTEQTETNVIANLGAKNNANFNFGGVVQNVNVKPGTIVCVEDNGTFSFSGTSDDKNYAAYVLKQFLLKAGTYKITGVSGGSNTTYWMRIGTGTNDTWLFNLYDAEREFNLVSDTLITVQIVIYANQTVSNLVFKPMIRPASITDDTFVPYAMSNAELTATITPMTQNEYDALVTKDKPIYFVYET